VAGHGVPIARFCFIAANRASANSASDDTVGASGLIAEHLAGLGDDQLAGQVRAWITATGGSPAKRQSPPSTDIASPVDAAAAVPGQVGDDDRRDVLPAAATAERRDAAVRAP